MAEQSNNGNGPFGRDKNPGPLNPGGQAQAHLGKHTLLVVLARQSRINSVQQQQQQHSSKHLEQLKGGVDHDGLAS